MKKTILALILVIAMLPTGVFAFYADDYMKNSYDSASNSVKWEYDLYEVKFYGSNASAIEYYNENNDKVSSVTFSNATQVELIGSFDIALLHKIENDEQVSDNLFTSVSEFDTEEIGVYKNQTEMVTLNEGEYSLAFIVNYGTYSTGDSLKIKISDTSTGGTSNGSTPTPDIKYNRNRDFYYTVQTTLPENALISDWAAEEVSQAFTKSIIPNSIYNEGNFKRPITRKEFAYIMVGAMDLFGYSFDELLYYFDNYGFRTDFTDTNNDPIIQIAKIQGIVNGTSETAFSPDELLTREQAATMLIHLFDNAQQKLRISKPIVTEPTYFIDRDRFSSWAVSAIDLVSMMKDPSVDRFIMGGVGGDEFLPDGNITVEQALIATKRLILCSEDKYLQLQNFINSQQGN